MEANQRHSLDGNCHIFAPARDHTQPIREKYITMYPYFALAPEHIQPIREKYSTMCHSTYSSVKPREMISGHFLGTGIIVSV